MLRPSTPIEGCHHMNLRVLGSVCLCLECRGDLDRSE